MKTPYQTALSSPNAYLQFLCDYQYDLILERAIGANIVNSNVGEENLYNALISVKNNSPETLKVIMNFPLSPIPSNSAAENALVEKIASLGKSPRFSAKKQLASFCSPDFTGPLTYDQQQAISNGACNTDDGNGLNWTSENTSTAISVLGDIFGTVGDWFGKKPPAPDDTTTTPTEFEGEEPTDYMPWVFAGVAVLVVVVVAVILYSKRKG